MPAIFGFLQYLIKEYFVYVMALYTLLFVLAVALFVKYRANHRRATNQNGGTGAATGPGQARTARRPIVSITGNKLIFEDPNTVSHSGKELIKTLGKTTEVYLVTQVKSDDDEKLLRQAFTADPDLKKLIKEHVCSILAMRNANFTR